MFTYKKKIEAKYMSEKKGSPEKEVDSEKELKENNQANEEEQKSKMFAEIKTSTKDIIDEIKREESSTISGVIEKAIEVYKTYKSISPEIQGLIQKYTNEYGNITKVIEEAIKVFDAQKNPERSDDLDLWIRAREEMKMMLIGKTTFLQLIAAAETPKDSLYKPLKRNIALDVILWYTRKPIKSLSLDEIISAIKKVWIVANYFYLIDVKKESADQYYLIFKHYQNKRYSNYWFGYFKELFHSEDLAFKCAVEGEAFDETLSLTIKKLHDKERIELDARLLK